MTAQVAADLRAAADAPPTLALVNGRGICGACGRAVAVRIDHLLRRHDDPDKARCPGSLTPPAKSPRHDNVAELDATTSKWLRIAADNLGMTIAEATTYAICLWMHLPLPAGHPMADDTDAAA